MPGMLLVPAVRAGQLEPPGRALAPPEADYEYSFKQSQAEELYRAGNFQDAARVYSGLIGTHPEAGSAFLRRGDCYASLEDFDMAIADSMSGAARSW